ncbi:MAG: PilN domain-containing protein [Pseudomonadota bacterium]
MQIDAILFRWLDSLALLAVSLHRTWRLRRAAVVTCEDEGFVLRRSGTPSDIIAHIAVGKPVPPPMAVKLRNHFLIFELAPENIVIRHLNVPAQAREFAAGIVGNQIERLSPWPPAQTVYGFAAAAKPDDAATLDVTVFITSRAKIEAARDTLASCGLVPGQISVRSDKNPAADIVLWTPAASAASPGGQSLPRLIGAGLAAAICLSAGITLWGIYSANGLQAEADDVTAQTETLRREELLSRRPRNLAALGPAARAWALKAVSPAMILILEAATRAIPDDAYVTQLRLDKADLRIIGRAADPPALIAALTKSKDFSEVRFFAPTVRSEDGNLYEFSIAAHVAPREIVAP